MIDLSGRQMYCAVNGLRGVAPHCSSLELAVEFGCDVGISTAAVAVETKK
jgi:hypothetical protein